MSKLESAPPFHAAGDGLTAGCRCERMSSMSSAPRLTGEGAAGSTLQLGIDENGLGPRLGPLVVTAVTARVEGAGHKRICSRPRGGLRARLGDSKRLVAFGDSA